MTKYIAIINNDEAEDADGVQSITQVKEDLGELIRSGYYELEQLIEDFDVHMLNIPGMAPNAD